MHRAHQREYEKYMEDIESSKMSVQELENSSDAALNYKFYRTMKTYVENLINCLNEKVCIFSNFFLKDDKGVFCQSKMRDTTQLKISSIRIIFNFNLVSLCSFGFLQVTLKRRNVT